MANHRSALLATAFLASFLPAQVSGTFVIDPNGAGSFLTLTDAINSLFVSGINGDVTLAMLPGPYTESVLVPPIPGTDSFHVHIKALFGPGTVQLNGSGGDTIALLGVSFRHNRSLVFEDLDFVSAPGFAISGTTFCEDMEIEHCTFGPNHRSTAPGEFRHALIVSENSGNEIGWEIHNCTLTVPSHLSRTAYGVYLSNGGGWNMHDNLWNLNGCDYCLWLINNNRRLDRIWNNQFEGSLNNVGGTAAANVCVIRADISNYENDIVHNTFAVLIPQTGCCIATGGIGGTPPAQNRMYGNVFFLLAGGTCIASQPNQPFLADGNVFWCPAGEVGRTDQSLPGFATLAAWQAASGRDAASVQADPLFVSPASPFDLHTLPGSPVIGAARNTPSYVTTDFDGRLRDAAPDAGAFESSGFALYGTGCAGTGALVPLIGNTGTVAPGSTNFAVTLAQAPGGTLVVLFGGNSRTSAGAIPLPFDLGGGCSVLAAPNTTLATATSPGGTASFGLVIPNQPAFRGTNLFFQWIAIDPGAPNALGVTTSNAGALQL
jgi:hypothetical protein